MYIEDLPRRISSIFNEIEESGNKLTVAFLSALTASTVNLILCKVNLILNWSNHPLLATNFVTDYLLTVSSIIHAN